MTKLPEFMQARVDALEAENAGLRALLSESKRYHYHVEEDCWYCCPACEDYCGDRKADGVPLKDCTCGANEWNAKVDAALAIDGRYKIDA